VTARRKGGGGRDAAGGGRTAGGRVLRARSSGPRGKTGAAAGARGKGARTEEAEGRPRAARRATGAERARAKPASARRRGPGGYPRELDPSRATGIGNRPVGVERDQQEGMRPGTRRAERIHGPAGDLEEQVRRRTGGPPRTPRRPS